MRPPSNIQTAIAFPSIIHHHHGYSWFKTSSFASMAAPRNQVKPTQIPLYHHIISFLRNSRTDASPQTPKLAHAVILRSGLDFDLFVSNNLLHSYCSHGSIYHAVQLFDKMPLRDVVSWNTMMSGFVSLGLFPDAFTVFREMMLAGTCLTQSSFASVMIASAEMGGAQLRQVHMVCLKYGLASDTCVGNALLKGYVELGGVDDLRRVMGEMCGLDGISVEILLKGYTKHRVFGDAFKLFKTYSLIGVNFSPYAISSLISLCVNVWGGEGGAQVHGAAVKVGFDMHVSIVNSLITLYARTRKLEDAELLFDCCRSRDIVTWNSLISGFAYNNEGDAGVCLILEMLVSGIQINQSTLLSFLSCCASINILESAKRAHVLLLKLREHMDQRIDNIVLTMYCKCGSLENAETMFESMQVRDIVSFNLITGLYRKCGRYEEFILLFFNARSEGLYADEVMFSGAVCSCSKLGLLDIGQQIHGCVVKTGFDRETHLQNSVLELYSQCGSIEDMERTFQQIEEPDMFSWNMILMGYANYGLLSKSILVWQEMETSGFKLNEFSYSALLDTCNSVSTLLIGEQIHGRIQKTGLIFDTVLMNCLLGMYSNCWMMEKALVVFKEISTLDSASWNAMVSGYAQNAFPEESVRFYIMMKKNDVSINHITYASIFMSCTMLTELKLGLMVHAQVTKEAFELVVPVSNSLITMYAKCGDMRGSSEIFERTVYRDVVTWNSMICAYANHGYGREAIQVLMQMISMGVRPSDTSFVGVLSACSRAGLIAEACSLFEYMHSEHGIPLSEEHYTCLVDVLCRSGKLESAKDFIESAPFVNSPMVWRTLLSACKLTENVKLGEVAARRIIQLEPQDSAAYVLLSDLYALVGKKRNKVEVRTIMEDRGVKKEVGSTWIC